MAGTAMAVPFCRSCCCPKYDETFSRLFLWLKVCKVMPRRHEAFLIFHMHDTAFGCKTSVRNGGGLIQCGMPTRPDQDFQVLTFIKSWKKCFREMAISGVQLFR